MKKRVVGWLLVGAGVSGAGAFVWNYQRAHAPPPYSFQTEPVSKHDVVGKITATGTLLATVTVTVGTQVSGRIQKILVDFNSPVKKGQLIAKIDPLLFQAAVEQARANLVQAQAQVESTKAQVALTQKLYTRQLALQRDNLAAQQDVDTAETNATVAGANAAVARASVAQAQAALHQAETNLDYANIVSPIDGTVILRNVDVGQTVAASLSTPTLFTIAQDLRKMQVNTNVSEGDVGRLEPGMEASFTVDAFPGRKFRGTISQIRNSATTTQNVVTYDAVIDVDNADLKLRPGMTANSTVVFAEKRGVLAVPNPALRFHPPPELVDTAAGASVSGRPRAEGRGRWHGGDGGAHAETDGGRHGWRGRREGVSDGGVPERGGEGGDDGGHDAKDGKVVWVLDHGHIAPVTVRTGLTDGTVTELLGDGLQEGAQVVLDVTSTGKGSGALGGGSGGQRRPPMF